MKKTLRLKIVSMVMVFVFSVFVFTVPSSAEATYYYNNRMYTSESCAGGRSVASFLQEMGNSEITSMISFYSGCFAGDPDLYFSYFDYHLYGNNFGSYRKEKDSSYYTLESGTDSWACTESKEIVGGAVAIAYTEHSSWAHDDLEDRWQINYAHDWSYIRGGWQP